MFESLSQRLSKVFAGLTGRGRLTPANMEEGLAEIRAALLEADVHIRVAKDLVERVREAALGQEILRSVSAGQMLVKLFHDHLVELMAAAGEPILFAPGRPTVVLLAGLQGSGKTTTAAKLALHWKTQQGRRPLLVAADVQRPAAVEQLRTLGARIDVPVFHLAGNRPERLAELSLSEARRLGCDTILVDTAGRLHVDAELMDELFRVRSAAPPDATFLVCDAMTGQDAVRSAQAFLERVPLDGVILTKLDGDSRGGAALSVRAVTGAPVAYVGVGEKLEDLQRFHAERLVGRILGMGDVVTLVEKAQAVVDEEQAEAQMQRMLEDRFSLEDFLQQLRTLRKMGSLKDVLGHLPGMPAQVPEEAFDEKMLGRTEAIVLSMTPAERRRPEVIDGSRRRRIAKGSGTAAETVSRLLKQFEQMRKAMKQMKKVGLFSRLKGAFGGGGLGLGELPDLMAKGPGSAPGPSRPGGSAAALDRRKSRKAERQRRKQGRRQR